MTTLPRILSVGAFLIAGSAHAGDGSKPSSIDDTLIANQPGITEAVVLTVNGALVSVVEHDASAAGNPEGIGLVRGANHSIPRRQAGKPLELLRVVADDAGNVFVTYASDTVQFGLRPITRRIKPDNSLGFDKVYNIERDAGIAPDGADGVYLAGHVHYALEGEYTMTMTHHRTYRLSPSGDVLWQVEAAGQPKPNGASQQITTAASNADGVFLGYGIGTGNGLEDLNMVPVIGHRAATDGAELYTKVGLNQPKVAAAVAIPPGTVGTAPLDGFVETIVIGSDGTAIASVKTKQSGSFIVRVDATGTQTDAYKCVGKPQAFAPGEMACVQLSPKLAFARYGVANGRLAKLSEWSIAPPAGVSHTSWTMLAGRRVLVAGRKDGRPSLRMYSSTGTLMTSWSAEVDGKINELGAHQGSWLGYGFGNAQSSQRMKGTYVIGGTAAPTSAPRTNPGRAPH